MIPSYESAIDDCIDFLNTNRSAVRSNNMPWT